MKNNSSLSTFITGFFDLMDKIQKEPMNTFSLLESFFNLVSPIFDIQFMAITKKSAADNNFTIISSIWKTDDKNVDSSNRETSFSFRDSDYEKELKLTNIHQLAAESIVDSSSKSNAVQKNMTLKDTCHGCELIYSTLLDEDKNKNVWVALNHQNFTETEKKEQLKNIEITLKIIKILYNELMDVTNRKSEISENHIVQFYHDLKPFPSQILDTVSFIEEALADDIYQEALYTIKDDLENIKLNASASMQTIKKYHDVILNEGWQTKDTNIYAFIEKISKRYENKVHIIIEGSEKISLYIAPPKVTSILQTLLQNTLNYGYRKKYLQERVINIKFYTKKEKEKTFLYIEYSNNGDPISEEKAKTIFEPKIGISKDDNWHIGLPNSLEIARKHNGNMILDTSFTQGVKFIISLESTENLL